MRPSLLVVCATFVVAIFVGTAAARPSPSKTNRILPAGATVVGGGLALLGTGLIVASAIPESCSGCQVNKLPIVVGTSLLLFGPTLARLPARDVGAKHLAVRLGGAAFFALSWKLEDENIDRGAQGLAFAGLAMVAGAVISDVATTPAAYRRWSERHAVGIAPVTATPRGAFAPGLSLSGRF